MTLWASVTDLVEPEHPYAETALKLSSHLLYVLTGEKFQGIQTTTEFFGSDSEIAGVTPQLINGQMYNLPTSGASNRTMSAGSRKLYPRNRPVREVIEIREMGKILTPSEYSIRNNTFISKSGPVGWLFDSLNELELTYEFGAKPPTAGVQAAIKFANQLIYAEMGSEHCSLPVRVSSVQRQNVSMTILDPQEFLDAGRTGLYDVDLFIKAYNPTGAKKKSKLFVAGRSRGERVT